MARASRHELARDAVLDEDGHYLYCALHSSSRDPRQAGRLVGGITADWARNAEFYEAPVFSQDRVRDSRGTGRDPSPQPWKS